MSLKSAAVLTVSDLYLQGKQEQSFNLILEDLNGLDYEVEKYVCVCENKENLAQEIQLLSQTTDIIIVIGLLETGCIYKGVALALSQELGENDKLINIIDRLKGSHKKEEVSLPLFARLLTSENASFPVIEVSRIYVLNVNCFEELYFNILKSYLVQYKRKPTFTKAIYIQLNGNTKQNVLKHKGCSTEITFSEDNSRLVCTATSNNFSDIVEFEQKLRNSPNIPYLGSCDSSCENPLDYLNTKENVQQTLQYIEESLTTYGTENIFLSFNGGKDCTVLLHLFVNLLKLKFPHYDQKIFCLYVRSENAFPEQDVFIRECGVFYNLEVLTIVGSIKDALHQVLEDRPNFKACLMGTRRTDPYSSNLSVFQMTDVNWPQIMRVSPILDWHYSEIWDYLLYYKVPYCKLYDLGYTSLGNSLNTIKNPCLKYTQCSTSKENYLPAYRMLNEVKERSGRNIQHIQK
ncbi:unnamed protein product [Brassicogethes aeneus]|uniref:FAD synthase n=1 Tax=Brassicogethes aeneus TaxID=1431903 RepID=A0A9P0ASR4_BRAAE|nr:unnamed protein product [Brassicogethes aeneus]